MIRADVNYYTQTRKTNEKTKHVKRISLLPLSYTVEPPNGHSPIQRPLLFCPGGQAIYIESYLKLSTTATATKASLQLPK